VFEIGPDGFPARPVREVRDPQFIGARRTEVALDQVGRSRRRLVSDGRNSKRSAADRRRHALAIRCAIFAGRSYLTYRDRRPGFHPRGAS
jgi:hypothetical protein